MTATVSTGSPFSKRLTITENFTWESLKNSEFNHCMDLLTASLDESIDQGQLVLLLLKRGLDLSF